MRVCCFVLVLACAAPAAAVDPAVFVQPSGLPTFVAACPTCNTREGSSFGATVPGRTGLVHTLLYPFTIGEGCRAPAGCSSFFAERTFVFGSCRQFYTPGNKCSLFPGGSCGGRGGLSTLNGYNGGFDSPGGCPGGGCR